MLKKKRCHGHIFGTLSIDSIIEEAFFYKKISEDILKWHHDHRMLDGLLRHPSDAFQWKMLDALHSEFASKPCNNRFSLASNRFNLFNQQSMLHST